MKREVSLTAEDGSGIMVSRGHRHLMGNALRRRDPVFTRGSTTLHPWHVVLDCLAATVMTSDLPTTPSAARPGLGSGGIPGTATDGWVAIRLNRPGRT